MSTHVTIDASAAEALALDTRLESIAPACLVAYRARRATVRTGCSRCDRDRATAQLRAAGETLTHCLASLPNDAMARLKDLLGGPARVTFRYRTGPTTGVAIDR